jgi:hypothetical protein
MPDGHRFATKIGCPVSGWYRTSSALALALLALAAGLPIAGQAEAQNGAASVQQGEGMTDVLVAPAVADSKTPAALTLDLSNSKISPQSRLELSVAPENVAPDEAYVVVVSSAGAPDQQLGSFSFYPPPRAGEVRKFLVNVPQPAPNNAAPGKATLSVKLVPVGDKDKFKDSSVRVVAARVVD